MTERLQQFVEAIRTHNPGWVSEVREGHGEVTIIVPPDSIYEICAFLKNQHHFDLLADLTGADQGPEEDPRFEVNYHLFSTKHFQRLRLKALVTEDDPRIESVVGLWRTADWHERETYDMFGVVFEGHPDLRRILLPSDFDGHALRKDYPLRGYEPYSVE
jgi:NADH-quinone oxidoreductase subunit C